MSDYKIYAVRKDGKWLNRTIGEKWLPELMGDSMYINPKAAKTECDAYGGEVVDISAEIEAQTLDQVRQRLIQIDEGLGLGEELSIELALTAIKELRDD